MNEPLRIAILAHSTNPRGGVVHALELGDALTRLGHAVTVHAPALAGGSFFRSTLCHTVCVAASPVGPDVAGMVRARIADYVRHFEQPKNRSFDVWHAQDGISGNALAVLKQRRLISSFARTVHHVDTFDDERLCNLQRRAITTADRLFVVSRLWQNWLARELDRRSILVGNGVDTQRYSPVPDATDIALRGRLDLQNNKAPVFLVIGGVEERKNSLAVLRAFAIVRAQIPSSRLVIAGGASLLDHNAYQAGFATALTQSALPMGALIQTGPLPQALMPALYRAATCLVFPSTREGFGLVVLEAMASGVPVVTSRIAPFTEYLEDGDVLWCEPFDIDTIAAAMVQSLDRPRRQQLTWRGLRRAAQYDWARTAHAHLAAYDELWESVDA
jgi:glycosyltransferase-like protein